MCWGWRTSGCRAAELQGHPAQMATAPRMCHRSCGSVSFICCNPALCRALGLIRAIESSCQLLVTLRIFSDFRTGLGQPHLLLFLRTDITNSNLKHSSLRSYGFSAMPPFNKKKISILLLYVGEVKGRGQTSEMIMLCYVPNGPAQAWHCLQMGDFLSQTEATVNMWVWVPLTFIIYKRMIISNNIHTRFKTEIVNVTLCYPHLDVMPADTGEIARILEIKQSTTPYSPWPCSASPQKAICLI